MSRDCLIKIKHTNKQIVKGQVHEENWFQVPYNTLMVQLVWNNVLIKDNSYPPIKISLVRPFLNNILQLLICVFESNWKQTAQLFLVYNSDFFLFQPGCPLYFIQLVEVLL